MFGMLRGAGCGVVLRRGMGRGMHADAELGCSPPARTRPPRISQSRSMASTKESQRPSNQEIVNTIRASGDEIRAIASKAGQLERDSEEHSVVAETLKKTDPARRCFRMIGGVMIERTVKEILPDLEEHRSNINEALKTLLSQYHAKNTEMQDYQKKWNVKVTVTP